MVIKSHTSQIPWLRLNSGLHHRRRYQHARHMPRDNSEDSRILDRKLFAIEKPPIRLTIPELDANEDLVQLFLVALTTESTFTLSILQKQ